MSRVATWFDEHQMHTLSTKLNSLSRKTPPVEVPTADRRDANWVRPNLVGEVRFTGITEAGRLRHPVWRGLRADIDPDEVTIWFNEVAGIAAASSLVSANRSATVSAS